MNEERDGDLVMFRFGETCPTCGGLHISRFAHDAGQAVEEYLNCWRSGAAGQAHNVIENWFARIYLRGVHDGRAGK